MMLNTPTFVYNFDYLDIFIFLLKSARYVSFVH